MLREWVDQNNLTKPDALLFRARNDTRPSGSNWIRAWHRALASVGQQPLRVYDCRHATATTWSRAGMPLAETARRLDGAEAREHQSRILMHLEAGHELLIGRRAGLRVAHGSLLDNPLDPDLGSNVWVATIWTDCEQPGGWGRLCWDRHPTGRGWTIHPLTHLGDVVEFGADQGNTIERWYGYVQSADETSLHIVGPFVEPNEASLCQGAISCGDGARSSVPLSRRG